MWYSGGSQFPWNTLRRLRNVSGWDPVGQGYHPQSGAPPWRQPRIVGLRYGRPLNGTGHWRSLLYVVYGFARASRHVSSWPGDIDGWY